MSLMLPLELACLAIDIVWQGASDHASWHDLTLQNKGGFRIFNWEVQNYFSTNLLLPPPLPHL